MSKTFTMDEIRKLAETNPAQLRAEYDASCKATSTLAERARRGLQARKLANAPPTGRFAKFVQNYGQKYIYTGSVKPIAHMMLIVGASGIAVEYLCHHRPAQKAKAAAAKEGHGHH